VLHLKHYEGRVRGGAPIRARSVIADVAQLKRLPGIMARPRYLRAAPEDVEDWAVAVVTFEDGTKATIHSNDTTLGGVRNVVSAYLTSGVVHANITPNTAVVAYAPEARVWGEEYITEKVETTSGWQFPSPEEDWMRGYPQELEDFVDAIHDGRPPPSAASATATMASAPTASCCSRRRRAPTSVSGSSTPTAARPRSRETACASSPSTSGITATPSSPRSPSTPRAAWSSASSRCGLAA